MNDKIIRRKTRVVSIGNDKISYKKIGGDNPILVQSMNTTDTRDVASSLAQIYQLAAAGCEVTRLAVVDMEAAEALAKIVERSPLPIVADIHFDYRLALAAIKSGVAKIRINPGNIGGKEKLRKVCEACKASNIPIRVGVNSGSLPSSYIKRFGGVNERALAACALDAVTMVHDNGIEDIVVSLKSSSPLLSIRSYRHLANQCDFPFHVGVTEAGTAKEGIIRSSVGIGTLLADGIGDTLRVSLTADPTEEVRAAWSILKSLDLRERGAVLISCPTCGRTEVNLTKIAAEVEKRLEKYNLPLKIAVMGCVVNGPVKLERLIMALPVAKMNLFYLQKAR